MHQMPSGQSKGTVTDPISIGADSTLPRSSANDMAFIQCDGKHPTCNRCSASESKCVYDVPSEGITKMQSLQQRLDLKTSELHAKTMELQNAMVVLTNLQQGMGFLQMKKTSYTGAYEKSPRQQKKCQPQKMRR